MIVAPLRFSSISCDLVTSLKLAGLMRPGLTSLPDHELYLALAELTRRQADSETDARLRQLLDSAVTRYIALAAITELDRLSEFKRKQRRAAL